MLTASLALNNHSLCRCDTSIIADDNERKRENLCPRKEKDEIPHNSTRGCSKCQPVSGCVCLPLCWSRCPRVAICHDCPFYICVCLSIYLLTHFDSTHTHTLGTLRAVEKSGRGCVSLQERWQKVVYMTPSDTVAKCLWNTLSFILKKVWWGLSKHSCQMVIEQKLYGPIFR